MVYIIVMKKRKGHENVKNQKQTRSTKIQRNIKTNWIANNRKYI